MLVRMISPAPSSCMRRVHAPHHWGGRNGSPAGELAPGGHEGHDSFTARPTAFVRTINASAAVTMPDPSTSHRHERHSPSATDRRRILSASRATGPSPTVHHLGPVALQQQQLSLTFRDRSRRRRGPVPEQRAPSNGNLTWAPVKEYFPMRSNLEIPREPGGPTEAS
jgi:hypothetical protein